MEKHLFDLYLVLYLLGHIIRATYERSIKLNAEPEKKSWMIITTAAGMFFLWTGFFGMAPVDPLKFNLSPLARNVGILMTLLGMLLFLGTVIQLRGFVVKGPLKTSWFFAKLRHPMYTGFLLWLIGWPVYHGALLSFIVGLFTTGLVLTWRRAEEKELIEEYGDTYKSYQSRTWF